MKKKLIKEKLSYAILIIDLSEEIGIPIKEMKKIVDTSISIIKPSKIDYNKLKEKILVFVVISVVMMCNISLN